MNLHAYHLYFDAPLHIGVEGIGQERIEQTVHSDTLWGALVQNWSLLFEDSPEDLAQSCPFKVSSCFPLVNGQRYFPIPDRAKEDLGRELEASGELKEGIQFKDLKKISYLSEPLMHKVLQGVPLGIVALQEQGSHLPCIHINASPHTTISQRPRLRIDRCTGTVEGENFFYCSDQYFGSGNGLFFLLQCDDPAVRAKFEAALRLLADNGLGADRSVGRGTFSFSRHDFDMPVETKAPSYYLLSLYHPTREELREGLLKQSTYTLKRRSGHAAAPGVGNLRRSDIWMIAEGAALSREADGDIAKVIAKGGPAPHPVFRYGKALTLPLAPRRKA